MRYALLICEGEGHRQTPEQVAADSDHQRWIEEMERRGSLLNGGQFRPGAWARSVRVRNGETLVSDGPFAETKDLIGGLALIECADLDEAVDLASRHPIAKHGTIEVRPIWDP